MSSTYIQSKRIRGTTCRPSFSDCTRKEMSRLHLVKSANPTNEHGGLINLQAEGLVRAQPI